ncbi:hypothetical protein [Microbacterium enclense]|uniref:hypothetical protein n=1 Tax=Microbacterium enclense TaxID=993073 RepID=UPI003449C6F5
MRSKLDDIRLAPSRAEGIRPGTDRGALVTATLVGLDPERKLAQVSLSGSDGVWVPAVPAIYSPGGGVMVSRSPLDGGRLTQCVAPLADADLIVAGVVKAINSAAGTLTVETLGGLFQLPYNAAAYTVNAPVYVRRDPQRFGAPVHVDGLQGNYVAPTPDTPGEGTANAPKLETRQAVIQPQQSGSWRSSQGRWDNWNTDRYGGISTLWQGNDYGSGVMVGWAGYGDQVRNLGAEKITGLWVNVVRADSSSSAGKAATVQGSPDGSRPGGAPGGSGDTATSNGLTPGQGQSLQLPGSTYDTWRTGGFKGIRLTGGDYGGFAGTSRADGMALTVQYTVLA